MNFVSAYLHVEGCVGIPHTFFISSSINSICGSISKGYILNTSSFVARIISTYYCSWIFCGFFSSWPLEGFWTNIWGFSFKVLCFFYLYLFLLSYSIFEVLWFLDLHFLLLSYSIGPCFNPFILVRYFYTN
jgi:hypothetical protein